MLAKDSISIEEQTLVGRFYVSPHMYKYRGVQMCVCNLCEWNV